MQHYTCRFSKITCSVHNYGSAVHPPKILDLLHAILLRPVSKMPLVYILLRAEYKRG